jgi:hypothetical protein
VIRRRRQADQKETLDVKSQESDSKAGDGAATGVTLTSGPRDITTIDATDVNRVDLGGLLVPGLPDVELRIEVDSDAEAVVSATLVHGESSVQLQAFAAPRTAGIWPEVRAGIAAGITQQGGTVDDIAGPFGAELRAQVPSDVAGAGRSAALRFVGWDGPRWFLRGVITGPAAAGGPVAERIESLFRDVVVVRGATAMAPREPIPLRLPDMDADALTPSL